MIECQSCSADSELWICPRCVEELRAALTSLAYGLPADGKRSSGLLDALADVRFKRTRMSGGGGHRKRGDELPAPFEPDTEKGKSTRQEQARVLLKAAGNTLTTIVRDICETRGLDAMRAFMVVTVDFIGPLRPGWRHVPSDWRPTLTEIAQWLATHVQTLACDEAAGQRKSEIDALVRKIERVIDHPPTPRFCGPCTHYVEHNRHCGRLLYAKYEAIEITCSACKTVHNIERLTRNLELRADSLRFTSAEILTIMNTLRTPIPERSWRRWRSEGRVKVRGYKRPDNADGTRGAMGLHRRSDDDEPLYRLAEVRRVYASAIKHADAMAGEVVGAR